MEERTTSQVTRPREEARTSYDRLSRWYDLLAGRSERRCMEIGLRALDAREGEAVLEIGPGTGRALVTLAQAAGGAGRVCGLDLSAGMLRAAQARLDRAGVREQVRLVRGDARTLPFTANCFDVLFMSFALELFDAPEIPAVLRECRRVLRPGGRIGLVALKQEERPRPTVRLYEWAHRTFPRVVDCRPIRLQTLLEGAGFRVTNRIATAMWGLPVLSVIGEKPGVGHIRGGTGCSSGNSSSTT